MRGHGYSGGKPGSEMGPPAKGPSPVMAAGARRPWFSDPPKVPDPLPLCLVCWLYGDIEWRHW